MREGRKRGTCEEKNRVVLPRIRFWAMDCAGCCEASPGRPSRGSFSSSPRPAGVCWGIPVADAMANRIGQQRLTRLVADEELYSKAVQRSRSLGSG